MKIIQRNNEYRLVGRKFICSNSPRIYTLVGYAKKSQTGINTVLLAYKPEDGYSNDLLRKSSFIEIMTMNGFKVSCLIDGYEDFLYDFYSQYVFDNYFKEVK